MSQKTVFITGANKGLGFEIAKQLGKRGFYVFLGVRDANKGKAAVDMLRSEGITCESISINAADRTSILEAANLLKSKVERLDVLINNAGINYHESTNILESSVEVIEQTIQTNAIGLLYATQAFVPLLGEGSRIINMSGSAGLTEKGISTLSPIYSMTKTMVNVITRQTVRALRGKKIIVNACCPGWTRTDMGGPKGMKSLEEGADTPVWLATDSPAEVNGRFVSDRTVKTNW
jgi:NAD(P)-dependent dehydrogenase (short-subunit alcohol dehydrogenase family)